MDKGRQYRGVSLTNIEEVRAEMKDVLRRVK